VGETLEVEQGNGDVAVMRDHDKPRGRIAGEPEPQTFPESAFSTAPTVLTPNQRHRLREIQAAADRDPQAYMEACRRRAR
jgi:hypothetical protein